MFKELDLHLQLLSLLVENTFHFLYAFSRKVKEAGVAGSNVALMVFAFAQIKVQIVCIRNKFQLGWNGFTIQIIRHDHFLFASGLFYKYRLLTIFNSFNYKEIDSLARQARPQKISLRRTPLEALCPPRDTPKCMPATNRYRTHDGTCNNKQRPRWGAAQMPFNRFLPPEYGDGVDTIRTAIDGTTLSSSRFISLLVHGAKQGDAAITLMTAQWGQLLDHDMTATAQPRPINGSVPSCCGNNALHASCYPITVPMDDPWLARLNVRCLEFLRSAPAQRRGCVLSWREQTNQATAFIDASPIYSNSAKLSDNTRTFTNGTLIFGRGNPLSDVCHRGALATHCLRSGDGRVGEQPGLLALHQVWVGEHNRIAQELATLNLHWSDDKIYQETRRILGAMFQHITYREFLPIILGREVCKLFDLELLKTGYYDGYDQKVNPTIANEFSAAAFRFGHSLIQDSYMRCDSQHKIISNNISLHEEFQRGDVGSAGSLHRLLRGMATQKALKRDEFITPELTNHLFQTPGFPFGLDLAAINIQRGRDHGIPPYTAWRVPCGLTPIKNWDDFSRIVGPGSARRIGHAYRNVHDIDLFVGGISERPVVGGLVGPTFACIIAQQFSNSRKGDRFWYENGGMESSFTPAQLQSIRQVLFSQVLCRAVNGGTFQTHIFIPADVKGNERLPCGEGPLKPMNLNPWKEQDFTIEKLVSKPNFEMMNPDRNFEVLQQSASNNLVQENKTGFPTKSPIPVKDKNSSSHQFTETNKNKFIKTEMTLSGTVQIKNMTKINDKLDIKRKQTHTKKPKPILGVNNKLDRGNIAQKLSAHIARPTRRKVVINNVLMELRSLGTFQDQNEAIDLNLEHILRNMDKTSTRPNTKTGKTHSQLQKDQNLTNNFETFLNNTKYAYTNDGLEHQLVLIRKEKGLLTENSKILKPFRPTFKPKTHTVTDYSRPQKVVLQKPKSDEYEIEINIRQTKKDTVTRTTVGPTPEYSEYETSYLPFNTNDRYSSQYEQSYGSHSSPQPNKQTRPPTIIYIDEPDKISTTNKPGFLQNFFYTKPPAENYQPTTPKYESVLSSGSLSVSYPYSSSSVPPQYNSYPQSVPYSQLPNAASTFNQISKFGMGTRVSSTAVSTGNFGSISGVATANDGDTSFSFNIRPKPTGSYPYYLTSEKPYASYNELPRPDFSAFSTTSYPPDNYFYNSNSNEPWSNQSPFSTISKAPSYSRTPNNELEQKEHKQQNHKLDLNNDYDYEAKTLDTSVHNDQLVREDDENDIDDYNEFAIEEHTNITKLVREDIFSPENMYMFVLEKNEKRNITNMTHLDDTYVLPLLNINKPTNNSDNCDTNIELLTTTDSETIVARQSNTEIFAEDDEFELKLNKRNNDTKKVAFAPIRIMTKPERPDNWIINEASLDETTTLPEVPDIWSESVESVEVPSPLRNMTQIWLNKLINDEEIMTELLKDKNFTGLQQKTTTDKNFLHPSTQETLKITTLNQSTVDKSLKN